MSQESARDSCQVCRRSNGVYFCEDCGAVLCADCVETVTSDFYFCGDCHSQIPSSETDNHPQKCPECGSEEIRTGRREEERCPRCHSTRLVLVSEKRRTLAQDLRQAINVLQYGHSRFHELSRRLTRIVETLVSLRMAKFVHYHWLERHLEELQEEVPALRNRIVNRAEMVARQMAAETSGIMHDPLWTADQFPFISGVVNRLRELGREYKERVDETLAGAFRRLEEISKTIEGLEYFRRAFVAFSSLVPLEVNELPVCALPDIRLTGSDFLKHDKAAGTLYLTDRRMVFIATTGTIRKRESVVFDFPLPYLSGIEEDGRRKKRLVLRMQQGDIRIVCPEGTRRVMSDYMEIARSFAKYAQTNLQRTRQLQRFSCAPDEVRIRILDLIDDLLSRERRRAIAMSGTGAYTRSPPPVHSWGYPETSNSPRATFSGSPFSPQATSPDSRYSLDGSYVRTAATSPPRGVYSQHYGDGDMTALLNHEIQETIRALRRGRLPPDEFVRRYRDLMRSSFEMERRFYERVR